MINGEQKNSSEKNWDNVLRVVENLIVQTEAQSRELREVWRLIQESLYLDQLSKPPSPSPARTQGTAVQSSPLIRIILQSSNATTQEMKSRGLDDLTGKQIKQLWDTLSFPEPKKKE